MDLNKPILLFLLLSIFACDPDDEAVTPAIQDNLEAYIERNPDFRVVTDSLIACALSGPIGQLTGNETPVSILFYPEGNAEEYLYFETDSISQDPDDLLNYKLVSLEDGPLFNGYLHRFLRPSLDKNAWCRVSYLKDGNIHISNAIRIKANDQATEYNSNLLTIDQTDNDAPIFSWQDGMVQNNAIYFQVILDTEGNLITGTYTFDKQFQFYNLSNVVLNIRDVSPTPTLLPNTTYYFLMMGVSLDNWVNLIVDGSFDID